MKRADIVELTLERLAFGGDGVAHASDGRLVFVSSGGAPGDRVRARIDEVKKRYARASLIEVIAAGAQRVAPECPRVKECGGCQWQEVSREAQHAAKHAIVSRALDRAVAPASAETRPVVAAASAYHYRSRARFTVGEDGAVGYRARRSHAVVDVPACPLLDPALEAAMAMAARALGPLLPSGATLAGLVGATGGVHLSVVSQGVADSGHAPRATPSLRTAAATLVSDGAIAGVVVDGERVGAPAIDCATGGEAPFFAAADGFAQAGHAGNDVLRGVVAEMAAADGARVLELYAGDGNFTRDLAVRAASIVAVESDAVACARLGDNVRARLHAAARAGATLRVIIDDAARAARRLVAEEVRFDLVLLDPPRAGAADVVPLLRSLAPRIVYVSCDPMTLARDAAALVAAGYVLVAATPLDLMPQTYHVETVCRFERR